MDELILRDAREFKLHVHGGCWALALLVARNVERGAGGRGRKEVSKTRNSTKTSAHAFARVAAVSTDKILWHLDAWHRAASDGHVPPAATLRPGTDPRIDWANLPPWGQYYREQKPEPTPKATRPKQQEIGGVTIERVSGGGKVLGAPIIKTPAEPTGIDLANLLLKQTRPVTVEEVKDAAEKILLAVHDLADVTGRISDPETRTTATAILLDLRDKIARKIDDIAEAVEADQAAEDKEAVPA